MLRHITLELSEANCAVKQTFIVALGHRWMAFKWDPARSKEAKPLEIITPGHVRSFKSKSIDYRITPLPNSFWMDEANAVIDPLGAADVDIWTQVITAAGVTRVANWSQLAALERIIWSVKDATERGGSPSDEDEDEE